MRIQRYNLFYYFLVLFSAFTLSFVTSSKAQTTITTTGASYIGNNSLTGPAQVSFVLENTNGTSMALTAVSNWCSTVENNSIWQLYYTATALSGSATDVTSAPWTLVATSLATPVSATGITPINFSGLNFIIPAATQYRFALRNTGPGNCRYSGTGAAITPNTFSGAGVNLKVGDVQIAAANVGYSGSGTAITLTPRYFTGSVTVNATTPCTGTPAPGNTLSSANPTCPSVNFNLSLQNPTAGSGVSYQWQSSPNGSSWTNIGSATNSTHSISQTVTTFYRCNVTCGANTTASNPIQITMNPFTSCYCNSGATSTADEDILNVTVGSLNNTSICGQVGPGPGSTAFTYNNYTSGAGAPAAPLLGQGSSVPFSLGIGTCGTGNFNNSAAIFIDLNQNGVFDVPSERLYLSAATSLGAHTETGTLAIPGTATLGITRMRVISAETAPANIVPCGSVSGGATSWGETEDYLVNIVSCVAGAFSAQPVPASISCGLNTSFSVTASGTAVTYQWQENISGSWNNITNGGVYGGATTNTLTLTGVPPTYNGYQYRCVIVGTCTPSTNSNAATLTVTQPPAPSISPAPPVSMCLGTPIALNITTAGGFGTPVVANFSQTHTPPLTCISACNISSPISITGIPTGAVITQVRVTMNMTHTWISDMVVNLKAPNGNVLNLFNGDGGAGDNFVNTVVSSAGVTLFSAGTPPYTGTFAPKASSAVGPAGSVSNVTTFSGLYSVPNGSWTLVLQDLFTGDEPFLNNWSIEITYTPIVPVQGTWTPTAGLFTNAGGTTPYTGGLASTVYASPAASTSYSVSYVVGTCTSPATNIPVTVNTPVAVSGQPANKSVCTDKSTTISVTATGTSPTYQWQVSTTGAAGPWANIANNANYAGATTNTLTISNPPTGWNTYQYRAVVSGAAPCGSVNSNPAILTVFALPTVGLSASPYTSLFPGLKTVLTATSSPSGAAYLWTLNGGAIAAATTSSWQADVDGQGVYGVRVTDINGCVNNTNTVTIGDSVSGKVFIYPSPNNGQFQVRYHSVKGNQLARSITVFDSKGSKVYSALIPVNRPYGRMDVDLRNVGAGVYTVELSDANGKRINTEQVVVF